MNVNFQDIFQSVAEGKLTSQAALQQLDRLQRENGVHFQVQRPSNENTVYFEPVWDTAELPVAVEPSALLGRAGCILMFADDDRVHHVLKTLAQRTGAKTRIILILPGDSYLKLSEDIFQTPRTDTAAFENLLQAVKLSPGETLYISHTWTFTEESAVQSSIDQSLQSLFHFFKALAGIRTRGQIRLLFSSIAGHGVASAIHAAVAGFGCTLQKENAQILFRSLLLDSPPPADWLAHTVLREWENQAPNGPSEVRYAGGNRQVRRIRPFTPAITATGTSFRKEGVYVLSGGLGGLGRVVAEEFATVWKARLVLIGRSEPRGIQAEWLNKIQAQTAVLHARADISSKEEVEAVLARARSRFGKIHGVIHAAGVIEDSLLAKKSAESFSRVLAPKIAGTIALDAATRDDELDFFILFSSLAGISGNPGQCDYAAGNRFLDAFAAIREDMRHRGERHGRTVSIDWPLWRDGGMQIPGTLREMMSKNWGVNLLEKRDGFRALKTAIALQKAQIGVLSIDPARFSFEKLFPGQIAAKNQAATSGNPRLAPKPSHSPSAEKTDLMRIVTESICEVLKVREADLNPDTSLDEYGVDSILLMEILQKLEARLDLVIDAAAIIDHSTINKLVQFLEQQSPIRTLRTNGHAPHTNGITPRNGASPLALEIPRLDLAEPRVEVIPAEPEIPQRRSTCEPIAVIAMACRFPGATSPEQFWDHIRNGRCLIKEIPRDRWNPEDYYSTDKNSARKSYSKWAGFIEKIDLFDAAYFGISEPDALGMDPQQRILLELAQELFDRGGYSRAELKGTRTSVIIGAGKSVYAGTHADFVPDDLIPHVIVNTIPNMIAGRIANFFDLRGTAETIDTACSSSLVAIHRACRTIADGEADMAVVGGVSLLLDPFGFVGFAKAGALARTPVPYIFDERANGFVMGEGAGLVLLKPLSKAIADGDQIAAVICGSAVNNDGHTMGLTTPNLEAQKAVLESAYALSGISPESIGYLEAHGTGTLLGDPIEVKAATQVFTKATTRKQYCGLGSVKSNIGHLFHAAGVSAFMKVVLSLNHGELVPTLHCERPHPRFRFSESPFFPVTKTAPLNPVHGVRAAAVSSFGFGGTNCHIVLTDFNPDQRPTPATRRPLPLTAFSRKRYWLENPSFRKGPVDHRVSTPEIPEAVPSAVQLAPARAIPIPEPSPDAPAPQNAAALIEGYLIGLLSDSLNVAASSMDPEASFDELGFDSTSLVNIARELETRFSLELYPTLLFEYPNIRRLSGYFADQQSAAFLKILQPVAPVPHDCGTPPARKDSLVQPETEPAPSNPAPSTAPAGVADLLSGIQTFLRRRLAEALSVPVEQISLETNFMEMGVDSVGLVQLAQEFEKEIGIELYPTLFFEYQNILELSGYFAREHAPLFESYLKKTGLLQGAAPEPAMAVAAPPTPPSRLQSPAPEVQRSIVTPSASAAVGTRDIAIIGMAGRFGTAQSTTAFWEKLRSGADMIREVPATRWNHAEFFDPNRGTPGKAYCRTGSFLEGADQFDASFFRVADQEAAVMDPQLRLLLETIQETADDAGYGSRIKGTRTGVYLGVCYHDYGALIRSENRVVDPYDGTGNATTMIANRPSYFWDLRGPSLAVDTACSSSLVALHLACQALRNGECDMALAGGVNLMFSPFRYLYFCSIGALSQSGRCHSFDERADGYVPGEAVATVLLKPLDQALRDGDPVHAVIKGTAINHGGYTNTVTAPSPRLESEVIVKAWRDAGIDPETISYLEAHGTGTKLGDPVEIQGMRMAFEQFTKKKGFCAVGSAKAHLGHAEGAAGIVGVIKTVLSMKNRLLPRMPQFQNINQLIRLEDSPLFINQESQPWQPAPGQPLRAGVSSFGFGGTYGHILLESYEETASPAPVPAPAASELFVLSARDQNTLLNYAANIAQWLAHAPAPSIQDLCWTFQTGREHFEERLAIITSSAADLALKLNSFAKERAPSEDIFRSTARTRQGGPAAPNPEAAKWLAEGRLEKLAAYWSSGGMVAWKELYGRECRRGVHAPPYPFSRRRHWFTTTTPVSVNPVPSRPLEKEAPSAEVLAFLRKHVADLLSLPPDKLDSTTSLTDHGFDSIMGMQLVKAIHEKFGITIYSGEALANPTLLSLAEFLTREISNEPRAAQKSEPAQTVDAPSKAPAIQPARPVTAPVLFVLSTPRSGSTLLRVMLAGHSRIFCPPELHLLPFSDMAERSRVLTGQVKFLNEGLIRAVMELRKVDAASATDFVQQLERDNTPTAQVYSLLQEMCGDRLLVDKSPSYGEDPRVLRRAAPEYFPHARFLFIARHPLAVMESFVRNRFDRMLGKPVEDPWRLAEEVWTRINRNILEFKKSIPARRWHEFQYEDLVRNPESLSRAICAFLEIPFENALVKPYEGERMTDGLHKVSLSIGDPNFLKHDRIDSKLAEEWRDRVPSGLVLQAESSHIAATLGYDLSPKAEVNLSAAQELFLQSHDADPRWHIVCRLKLRTEKRFDPLRATAAWRSVIAAHPQLQVSFVRANATWSPRENPDHGDFQPELHPMSSAPEAPLEDRIAQWIAQANDTLDARVWPLLKVAHFASEDSTSELVCVLHHLVADGLSMATLVDDFFSFYFKGRPAVPVSQTFLEYCRLQREGLSSPAASHEISFWKSHLPASRFVLADPESDTFRDEVETETVWLDQLNRPVSTGFEPIAAALYRTLAEWTKNSDVTIAHRLHGREAGGTVFHGVCGCFASDIPLRLDVPATRTPSDFPRVVKALRASAPLASFGPLAAAGRIPTAPQVTGVRFNYQPFALGRRFDEMEVLDQQVRTFQPPDHPRPYQLDLIVRARTGEVRVIARHGRALTHEAVSQFLDAWRKNLEMFSLE